MDSFDWLVLIIKISFILLAAVGLLLLFKRFKIGESGDRSNQNPLDLEGENKQQLLQLLQKKGIEVPLPESELNANIRLQFKIPHPHLVEFVDHARMAGLPDEQIKEELQKAGWKPEEIQYALGSR